MASIRISPPTTTHHSSLHLHLSKLSSSSSSPRSKSPFFSIRSSYPLLSLSSPPSLHQSQRSSITAFLDLDDSPHALADDPPFEDVKIVEEIRVAEDLDGGSDGGAAGDGFDGGDDGGGDGGEGGEGDGGEESGKEGKRRGGMSMSQKLTLGYAALVGAAGHLLHQTLIPTPLPIAAGLSPTLLHQITTSNSLTLSLPYSSRRPSNIPPPSRLSPTSSNPNSTTTTNPKLHQNLPAPTLHSKL